MCTLIATLNDFKYVVIPNLIVFITEPSKKSQYRPALVSAVRLPACHLATVPVQVKDMRGPVLIESEGLVDDCLQVDESLVEVDENGLTTLLITNNGKSPYHLKSGEQLAHARLFTRILGHDITRYL